MTDTLQQKASDFMLGFWNDKSSNITTMHSEFFSEHLHVHSPLGNSLGREYIQGINMHWFEAFPDLQLSHMHIEINGGLIITDWIGKATHTQKFKDVEPTGKQISYKGKTLFYFSENKVVSYFCQIDMLEIYEQLGFFLKQQEYDNQKILCANFDLLVNRLTEIKMPNGCLSRREIEVLSLWLFGFSAKEIAKYCGISYRTVQNMISNVSYKCDCITKQQLRDYIINKQLFHLFKDLAFILMSHKLKI